MKLKHYHLPVDRTEEIKLLLTDEMDLVRQAFNKLGRLYAGSQYRQLANELANLQAAARSAEWTVNRLIFPEQKLSMDVPDDTPRESER